MAMEHTERKLVELGDSDFAKIQAGLHEAFKKRHPGLNDISLPSIATPASNVAETKPLVAEPLPSSEQLIKTESEALKGFFGKDIAVLEPPQELFQTLEKMSELGITGFEPHFLPQVSLTEEDKIPGWKVRPESWFWQQITRNKISQDAATLYEGWYLVDGRKKPNYDTPNHDDITEQRYGNDYAEPIMQDLRNTGKIQKYKYLPDFSRFGASLDEIEQVVLPEVVRRAGMKGELTNKRYIEFNFWGNMFHPEWGQTNTMERFADKFGDDGRLYGGFSEEGGLAHVHGYRWSGRRDVFIAFSPVVRFPSRPR